MHRMMKDRVDTPYQTWTEADELQLEMLANDFPFLRRTLRTSSQGTLGGPPST